MTVPEHTAHVLMFKKTNEWAQTLSANVHVSALNTSIFLLPLEFTNNFSFSVLHKTLSQLLSKLPRDQTIGQSLTPNVPQFTAGFTVAKSVSTLKAMDCKLTPDLQMLLIGF